MTDDEIKQYVDEQIDLAFKSHQTAMQEFMDEFYKAMGFSSTPWGDVPDRVE